MSDTETQVLRLIETYKSAVLAKNVDTFMHLYDPEVRVFDTWGTWSYEGAAAWRLAIEGRFSSLRASQAPVGARRSRRNDHALQGEWQRRDDRQSIGASPQRLRPLWCEPD